MSPAAVDIVQADQRAAVKYIKQARTQFASAKALGNTDRESSYALCYQAAIKALTGMLLSSGRRISAGESGHVLLIRESKSLLVEQDDLLSRFDLMRRVRHQIFYDLDEVSVEDLVGAQKDVEEITRSAAGQIAKHVRSASTRTTERL